MKLIEIAPNRYRFVKDTLPPARSALPLPYVISDEMPETEQVDGRHYTSKAAFRRVGRALGLTEVGTEKFAPKRRSTDERKVKEARRQSLRIGVEKYRAGHRPRR